MPVRLHFQLSIPGVGTLFHKGRGARHWINPRGHGLILEPASLPKLVVYSVLVIGVHLEGTRAPSSGKPSQCLKFAQAKIWVANEAIGPSLLRALPMRRNLCTVPVSTALRIITTELLTQLKASQGYWLHEHAAAFHSAFTLTTVLPISFQ